LVWASALGWLIFSDVPSQSTWIGAVVILATTLWIARREGQQAAKGLLDDPVG
jgi:drug/metabolite transporter (DMT)-like permease